MQLFLHIQLSRFLYLKTKIALKNNCFSMPDDVRGVNHTDQHDFTATRRDIIFVWSDRASDHVSGLVEKNMSTSIMIGLHGVND